MTSTTDTDQVIRPFAAFLTEQRKGLLHTELSEQLHALLASVKETGKGGTLTLQIKVKPASKGDSERILISDVTSVKAPAADRLESLFFLDDNGNPSRTDPRQQELPGLLEVPRPAGEVREVGGR